MSNPTPAPKKDVSAPEPKGPETVYVKAVYGKMLNLYTNVWLTTDPKKVELDDFVRGQVEAGKLEIVPA